MYFKEKFVLLHSHYQGQTTFSLAVHYYSQIEWTGAWTGINSINLKITVFYILFRNIRQ